jgi:pyrroloquinoline quinone biosynthesis protein B
VQIRILGSAAGGRFPQWNCGCANCLAVRQNKFTGKARTQAQLALSADGSRWLLVGASPDLASQIEANPELHPRALRDSPVAGVVLGSADLDHVVGLLLLRELQPLRVYAAPSILKILREENSMFGMLNRVDPQVVWTPIHGHTAFPMLDAAGQDSGLRCAAHWLSGRYPKYVKSTGLPREATAALFFASESAGSGSRKRLAYVPAIEKLDDVLLGKIEGADLLLFDGTFWSDDELIRVQGSGETAHQMGHIPIEESLDWLKNVEVGRKMFIHLNNTNPVLNEAGEEHRAARAAGWEIAEDNWRVEL